MQLETRRLRRRWLSNSLANLIGGGTAAITALLLPAILVRHVDAASFAVWNLALQIIVYVNLLSLGLQTATARAVAHADVSAEGAELPLIVSTSRYIAHRAAAVAVLVVVLLAAVYPLAFPHIPEALATHFRATLLFLGVAAAIQIHVQPEMGVFQGLHRNVVFVAAQTLVRILSVLLVCLGIFAGADIVQLGLLLALSMSTLWPVVRYAFTRLIPWASRVRTTDAERTLRNGLLRYCASLSVWSVSMALITSSGLVLVGRIDFEAVGDYAIAATAVTVFVGLLNAILSPLLTLSAALNADDRRATELPKLLAKSTLSTTVLLNILFLLTTLLHPPLIRFWVGESFVNSAGLFTVLLIGAHSIRNLAAPYALMLLATGLHRRALLTATIEGCSTVLASAAFGLRFGATGVAYGTLFGAVLGLTLTLAINCKRTPELTPHGFKFALRNLLLPSLAFAPAYAFVLG